MKKITIKFSERLGMDVYCAIEDYLDWLKTWLVDRRVLTRKLERNKKRTLLTNDEQKQLDTYHRLIRLNKKLEIVWED